MINEESNSLMEFEFNLIAKTKSGIEKEALEKVKFVYPYKIDKENILIEETNQKGLFRITVNKNGFAKNEVNYLKISIFFIITALIFILSVVFIRNQIMNKKAESLEKKQIEKINEERIKLQKEKLNQFKEIETEYEIIEKQKYENVYGRIELIYSLLLPSTTIENLNIDDDNFYIDLTTKDTSKLLSNFENSPLLSGIQMNRTTVLQKDIISINGSFLKHIERTGDNLSIEEKINFYNAKISLYKSRKEKQNNTQVSAYINRIRTVLHKHNCSEQYIQIKGAKENLEAEVLFYSSAENIFRFLNEIQSGTENLYDIKSFHLRNSENQQHIQSVITFKTGISLKSSEEITDLEEIEKFTPKEMSSALYKAPSVKIPEKKVETVERKTSETKVPQRLRKLNYIGLTKINGKNYVMAKDSEMNVIYKLQLSSSETEGDFCLLLSDGNYKAKIRDEWFEVKK